VAEPAFTERQWKAIARIEECSCERWFLEECVKKQIYGPTFADGEYYIAWAVNRYDVHPEFVGPVEHTFSVIEALSGLVLGAADNKLDALKVARDFIALIGRKHLLTMRGRLIEAATVRAADAQAKAAQIEAAQAIAKAQQKPRKIAKRARAVFEASEGKCHYCETVLTLDGKWHIEHKIPRALFGGSEQSNLVASCTSCNHAKRDKTDLEFIAARNAAKAG
jgi:hypothetical protein